MSSIVYQEITGVIKIGDSDAEHIPQGFIAELPNVLANHPAVQQYYATFDEGRSTVHFGFRFSADIKKDIVEWSDDIVTETMSKVLNGEQGLEKKYVPQELSLVAG